LLRTAVSFLGLSFQSSLALVRPDIVSEASPKDYYGDDEDNPRDAIALR
jgi:hypothetical protein